MRDPLGELGVEAGTALFDPGEVEAGRVGDRLQVVGRGEVGVGARDRWVLAGREAGDGVWEAVAWLLGRVRNLSRLTVSAP